MRFNRGAIYSINKHNTALMHNLNSSKEMLFWRWIRLDAFLSDHITLSTSIVLSWGCRVLLLSKEGAIIPNNSTIHDLLCYPAEEPCLKTLQSLRIHSAKISQCQSVCFHTNRSSTFGLLGWWAFNSGSVFRERSSSAGCWGLEMTRKKKIHAFFLLFHSF